MAVDCRPADIAPIRSARDTSSAKRLNLHFLITLWRWALTVRAVQPIRASDLLVGVAANDKLKDFPLARRQGCDLNVNGVQFVFLIA